MRLGRCYGRQNEPRVGTSLYASPKCSLAEGSYAQHLEAIYNIFCHLSVRGDQYQDFFPSITGYLIYQDKTQSARIFEYFNGRERQGKS